MYKHSNVAAGCPDLMHLYLTASAHAKAVNTLLENIIETSPAHIKKAFIEAYHEGLRFNPHRGVVYNKNDL